jgi:hypothetical protein
MSLPFYGQIVSRARNNHEAGSKLTFIALYGVISQEVELSTDNGVRTLGSINGWREFLTSIKSEAKDTVTCAILRRWALSTAMQVLW